MHSHYGTVCAAEPHLADGEGNLHFGRLKLFAPLAKLVWKCLTHPFWGYVCLLVELLLLARPVVVNAVTKYCAKLIRLGVRQLFTFISMLLESVADELIYQLDYALRESLPPHIDFKEAQKAPIQTFAHLLSAGFGAGLMYLATIVRAQRAVQYLASRFQLAAPPPPLHSPKGGFGSFPFVQCIVCLLIAKKLTAFHAFAMSTGTIVMPNGTTHTNF